MIKTIRKTKKAYRAVVFMLIISMFMTGCTNLIGGTTPEKEFDYGILEEGSGMIDENGQLKESTRTGVNARLNYLAGGDYGAEKYSASYKDAFFIAEDLSNDIMDVSYFKLLDTYTNVSGNTAFVYIYQTKQYADGGKRTGELVRKQETGDYVLYPDVYTEEELPVSDTYVTVLATYAYEEGETSYHEIARIDGDAVSSMIAKPVYASESSNLVDPKVSYYTVLSKEKIYVYNADAVKVYSNKLSAKSEISSGLGNITDTGVVDSSFGTVLSTGFEKVFDIQAEFNAFKSNDETLKNGNYDIDVYDYSVFTDKEDFYVTLDVSATKQGYTGPDIEVEVVDADGNPISTGDDQDETVEDDVEEGAAFDFVGTICHVKLPEGLEFQELYSPTKTEKLRFLGALYGVAREFNYQLVPVDSIYYADKASSTVYGTSDWFSPYFGFYSYVVTTNGGGALDVGRSGFFSFASGYGENTNCLGEYVDEDKLKAEIDKRKRDSGDYKYENKSYKLVTNPDAYWSFYQRYGANKYTINLTGDFEIVGDYTSLLQDFFDTQVGVRHSSLLGIISIGDGIDYHGTHYNVWGSAINGLKFKLYNGYLDASAFATAEAGVVEPYYLCDDLAVFKGNIPTDDAEKEPEQYLTPYVIPLTQITNIMTDYSWLSEKLIKIALENDAGAFHGIETAVYDGKLYVFYIYDKKVIMCQPDSSGLAGLAADTETIGIDRIDLLINNLNETGLKNNTDRNRTYGTVSGYYNGVSQGGFECYVLDIDKFAPGALDGPSSVYQFTGNTAEDNFKTGYTSSVSANIDPDDVTSSAQNGGTAGGTAQVYYESSADGVTRKYISIVFGYENEGVSFYDNSGNPVSENVAYSDIIDVLNGTKTIGSIVNNNTTIINNWDVSQANSDTESFKSIKDVILQNLHYRYSTFVIDNGDGTYNIEIRQVENTGDITLYTYTGIKDAESFSTQDRQSGTVVIDDYTWLSLINYVSSRLQGKSGSQAATDADLTSVIVNYEASSLRFITGTFDNDGVSEKYIVSTTPSYGLGFYDIGSGQYFVPTFQRHEVHNVTTTTKTIDNVSVKTYDLTNSTDEIVSLENVAAYGIYENKGSKSDVYPYYLMGYDRKGMTYTNVEMIKAKMVPFGVAYATTDESGNTVYYKDFTPVVSQNMVYYLPTAYFNQYGMIIIDNSLDDDSDDPVPGGDPSPAPSGSGDDPYPSGGGGSGDDPNPTPSGGSGGDDPYPSGGPGTDPSGGGGSGDDPNPTPTGGGGGGDPTPSGGPGTDPSGGGGGGNDPYPSGGGGGDNPYPSGGGGGDNPYPSGGGGGDNPYPSGGGGGDNPYPSGGGGGGDNPYPSGGPGGNPTPGGGGSANGGGGNGNGGFTGEVYSNQPRITSLYGNGDGTGDGDGSISGNGVSDNSASDNSVSGNGGRTASQNDTGTDTGSGTGTGLTAAQAACLILLILLIILIIAWIIYRKRKGLPIIPLPAKKEKKEEDSGGVSSSESNDDLFEPVEGGEIKDYRSEVNPGPLTSPEDYEEPEKEYNFTDDDFLDEEDDGFRHR